MLAPDTAVNLKILRLEITLGDLLEKGIDAGYFEGASKDVFVWIKDHFNSYGQVPNIVTAKGQWGVEILGDEPLPEPNVYYLNKLQARWKRNRLKEGVLKSSELIKEEKLDEAEDVFSNIAKITKSASSEILDITKKTDDRILNYNKAKEAKDGVNGIPSGWGSLDKMTTGWHGGEVNIFAGRMGIGKTWTLIYQAVHCWKLGLRPLFISMEMPPLQIGRRFDAALFNLPFGDLKKGKLDAFTEKSYFERLAKVKEEGRPFLVVGSNSVKTAADVEILIRDRKPDVVYIDGVYIIGRDKGHGMWERVSETISELKIVALSTNIPIVGTTQFNRHVKKENIDTGLENLSFSDALAQFSDCVIGLFRTTDMRLNHQMLFQVMKNREGESLKFVTKWDFLKMDFSELAILSDNNDVQASQDLQKKSSEPDMFAPF